MSAGRKIAGVAAVLALAAGAYWVARVASAPPDAGDWPDAEDTVPVSEPEADDLAPGEHFEVVGALTRDVFETFPGRISAEGRHEIRAPKGMRVAVTEIVKDEGDFVKAGDVVVRLNREEVERAIRQAEEKGDAEAVKRFRGYLDFCELRSDVDGIVLDVWTELGRVPVDEGIPLVTIAARDAFLLRVQVPARVTKTVAHIGARLTAELDANLGRVEGTLTGFEAAPEGWTMLVIGLDEKEGLERDMTAMLRVPTSKTETALVPKAAVRERGGVRIVRVWEPDDRTIGERTVLVDGESGDRWIVTAGVFPGESVVVAAPQR